MIVFSVIINTGGLFTFGRIPHYALWNIIVAGLKSPGSMAVDLICKRFRFMTGLI